MSWTPFSDTKGEKKGEKENKRNFFEVINTFSLGWNNNTRIGET